jgi:hypothetical protein
MLQTIKNVVLGRVVDWNRTFGEYFTYLQTGNTRLITRIGKDPMDEIFSDCFSLAIRKMKMDDRTDHSHDTPGLGSNHWDPSDLAIAKVVLGLNRFILLMTSEVLLDILLGRKCSPFLNVAVRKISAPTTRNLVLGSATGYAFCATVPEVHQSIRHLLLITLVRLAVDPTEMLVHMKAFSSAPHTKYFNMMADHVLDAFHLDHGEHVASRAALISIFDSTAVTVKKTTDHLLTADVGELEKFLTTA